jgi:hypothetical protein
MRPLRIGRASGSWRLARAPPTSWAAMKLGADAGAIPAKVLENIRPMVMAGLAKLAEEVKKYAAPM